MNEITQLLTSVLQAPEDPTPRLILADRLEELNHPAAAIVRGASIERDRNNYGRCLKRWRSSLADGNHPPVCRRFSCQALERTAWRELAADIATVLNHHRCWYCKGRGARRKPRPFISPILETCPRCHGMGVIENRPALVFTGEPPF